MNRLPKPPLELFELATGYQRAKTLFALIEFEIPTLLDKTEGLTTKEIARRIGVHPRATDRLLNAAVALGLLQRSSEEVFSNAPLTAEFLVKNDQPTYLGAQFLNYDRTSYPNWADLTEKLREWEPGANQDETPQEEDQGADSMRAQHNLALLVGNALAHAYDFAGKQKLLDVGGGTGAMSIALCKVYPQLRAKVFDLPPIVKTAAEFIAKENLSARIKTVGGDFKTDELPDDFNFEVALLANLLSVADEKTNLRLFEKIYKRLPAGGAIILSGWMLEESRTAPLLAALFCLEDIGWEAPDVEHTVATYRSWLERTGFTVEEEQEYCPPTRLIVGRK